LDGDVLRRLEEAGRLTQAVDGALAAARLPIRELTVAAAADGVVSLFGVTESEPAKRRADEIARAVPGVVRVPNTIIVIAEPGAAPDPARLRDGWCPDRPPIAADRSDHGGLSCLGASALRCFTLAGDPAIGVSEMAFRITITDEAEVQLQGFSARERRTLEAAIVARLGD
jgi:hypothetical protein